MGKIKNKSRYVFEIVSGMFQIGIIFILLLLVGLAFGARIPILSKMGWNFFAVTSGSMEPVIPTGSIIRAGHYKLDMLKEGDIITYQIQKDNNDPIVVTHRIHEIKKTEEIEKQEEQNEEQQEKKKVVYEFITKGDANNKSDDYIVRPGNIVGLYKGKIPYLGYIVSFAHTLQGFILLVIVPASILIIWEVVSLILSFKNYYEQKSKKEVEKLRKQLASTKKEKK